MTFPSNPAGAYGAGIRLYQQPAPKVIGYPIDGYWGIVEPPAVDIANLIANPSIELNTLGFNSNAGGTFTRVATRQRRGAYSLEYTPLAATNDGPWYSSVPLINGSLYNVSFDFLGVAGNNYDVKLVSTTFAQVGNATRFTATGQWQRIHHWYKETASLSRYIYILKRASANLNPFYIDGLMCAKVTSGDPLIYFDGDSVGYVPNKQDFYWTAAPHASSSVMKANTRAGGYVRSLGALGFTLLATMGLGLATPDNVVLPLALPGGEQYQDTLAIARTFDLVGMIEGGTPTRLKKIHSGLADLLDTRRRPYHQEMTLLYEELQECGDPAGELVKIQCSFAGGLEGTRDNNYREDLDLRFRIHLPYVAVNAGSQGAALNLNTTVANANYIIYRDALGNYSALGAGANNTVSVVLYHKGTIYAGGTFTLMNGVANTVGIAKYDVATGVWTPLGTGATGGTPQTMAVDALGNLYVGGTFTGMGGVANTRNIAKWNGSAWSALGTGAAAGTTVGSIVAGPDGRMYAMGIFPSMGGVANTANIAAWTGAAWVSITPAGAAGSSVTIGAFGPDGNLYVSGNFTTINAVPANRVAKYNPTTGVWSALGTGIPGASGVIQSMAFGPDGLLYVGGTVTSVGGQAVDLVATWNGFGWSELGLGITGTTVNRLVWNPYVNQLYLGGSFTAAGGLPMPESLTIWNGSQFLTPDVDLPGTPTVTGISIEDVTGAMVFGYSTSGSASAASTVTVLSNSGTADTFPILKWVAPTGGTDLALLFQITNQTTGENVYLFDLTLMSGETFTFDFRPGHKSITSDFRGDLTGHVAPGSNMASFHLAPGDNAITVFQQVTAGSSPTGSAYWYPAYAELEDTVR